MKKIFNLYFSFYHSNMIIKNTSKNGLQERNFQPTMLNAAWVMAGNIPITRQSNRAYMHATIDQVFLPTNLIRSRHANLDQVDDSPSTISHVCLIKNSIMELRQLPPLSFKYGLQIPQPPKHLSQKLLHGSIIEPD